MVDMPGTRRPARDNEEPLPRAGTILVRSMLTGFVAGALIGVVVGSAVGWVYGDPLSGAAVGVAFGILYGLPFGLLLGILMAVWRGVARPRRSTVRLTVTVLSTVAAIVIAWALSEGWSDVIYVPIPFVGIATWFGIAVVLKPSRPDTDDDPPRTERSPTIAWDRDVSAGG